MGKALRIILTAMGAGSLAGCVVYDDPYAPAPGYYYGPPAYYAPAPSIGLGFGFDGGGGRHWHGHRHHGHRHHGHRHGRGWR